MSLMTDLMAARQHLTRAKAAQTAAERTAGYERIARDLKNWAAEITKLRRQCQSLKAVDTPASVPGSSEKQLVDAANARIATLDAEPDGDLILETTASQWNELPSAIGIVRKAADYRLSVRHRRFPAFSYDATVVVSEATAIGEWTDVERRGLAALLAGNRPRQLARFQLDTLNTIRRQIRRPASHGTIITAGTGSGKTLAAYLPALLEVTRLIQPNQFWTKMLCLYPRNELLKDQLLKALQETDRLQDAGLSRPIRIGAFFGATPFAPNYVRQDQGCESRSDGIVCPFLRCPTCGGGLVWSNADRTAGRERVRCVRCRRELDESRIALTRRGMERRPPDLLFTSTESLNRQLASSQFRGLFGIGRPPAETPRVVLLDEVHTYDGVPGAQAALLLRRWRHAIHDRPVQWIGLSATLQNPVPFFSALTGLPEDQVIPIDPAGDEIEGGLEYLLAVRGDPASRRSLLSTTIQAAMLLGRALDPLPPNPGAEFTPPSGGAIGQKAFLFSDDWDVINRLFHDLLDAEANPPRYGWKEPLANLRDPNRADPIARDREGQDWWLPHELGHRLDARPGLRVARTTAQSRGVDDQANLIVCSAALEVGFDDDRVGAVVQHKAPLSLASFVQRRGRAGRRREMRPWTVLVLSDYGRDRVAYQAPEHLFSPSLPPRVLPLRNRYVLRIQAVFSLLDWLADQAGRAGRRLGVWNAFAGPAQRTETRRDQEWLAGLIEEVLDAPTRASELARHLEAALGINAEEVRWLLWDPPRSLLLAVLPTALRRLRANWAAYFPDGSVGQDTFEQLHPLPDFMPANLFSDLQLPELGLALPGRNGMVIRERMPLVQGMANFAPGRVSRRFAVDAHAELSHWVPITGAPRDDLPLARFCPAALPLGEFAYADSDKSVRRVSCFRPLEYVTELCPEDQIAISSNAFLRWHSQLFAQADGVPLKLPATRPFAELELALDLFAHAYLCPATVRRFSTGADADFRRKNEDPIPCEIRFVTAVDEPAAVGFEIPVDALRLRFRRPPVPTANWLTDESLRVHRVQYFHHCVVTDPALRSVANSFLLNWIAEIHLAILTTAACEPGASESLADAADRIAADYPVRVAAVIEDLLQFMAEKGEEEDEASLGVQLRSRFALAEVRNRLAEHSRVLWEDPRMDDWLQDRFTTTMGAVFVDACTPAISALGRMVALVERAPAAEAPPTTEPVGLRDFYLALRAGDRAAAEVELRRLEGVVDWTEENLLGLRVELLAQFGAWRELLGLPEFPQLTTVRRTPALTRAVLGAFYHERLARLEINGQWVAALTVFRDEVGPAVRALLAVRTGLNDQSCRRLFAYQAAAELNANTEAALLMEAVDDSERESLRSIFAAAAPTTIPWESPPVAPMPTVGSVELARAAYDDGDLDRAYALLLTAPNSVERVELLFDCADEIRTLETCGVGLQAFHDLLPECRDRLARKPRLRRLRRQLEASVAAEPTAPTGPPPGSWPDLFDRIDDSGNLDLPSIARRAASEWPADVLTRDDVQRIVNALYQASESPDRRRMLLDLLPHLLGAVQQAAPGSDAALHPLRIAIFELLALKHDYHPTALVLIRMLAGELLSHGLTIDEYRAVVGQLVAVWEGDPSKGLLNWLVEVLEVMADNPSPARAERQRVLGLFPSMSPALLQLLTLTEWDVFEHVAKQLGQIEVFDAARAKVPPHAAEASEEIPQSDAFALLAGRRIGVYTLFEPSGIRARDIIHRRSPTCEVIVNSDKVKTGPLTAMARTCDIVVVVIRVSKHMATEPIEDIRRDLGKPTIRAIGASASSVVRELETYLMQNGLR